MDVHGFTLEEWRQLFWDCHEVGMGGLRRVEWPDGGALMGQPDIVVRMFGIVAAEEMRAISSKTEG